MKPRKRITDPTFRYTPSHATNIRVTFAKERARLRKMEEQNVTPLRKPRVA